MADQHNRPADHWSVEEMYEKATEAYERSNIQQACRHIKEVVLRCESRNEPVPENFRVLASKIMNFDESFSQTADSSSR